MTSDEIRQKFLKFFETRGHTIVPSAPLVPENDPTVLFNTAGMQPLVPYLMGAPHPAGDKLASVQKCLRTVDIEDIGDNTHATFFEMLGNWSLGAYFKTEAIKWSYQLLTSKEEGFGLDPDRLYITVYAGDDKTPLDEEAVALWQEVGVPKSHIYYLGADSNWWPNVKGKDTWTGPTGPSSEMFYDLTDTGLGGLTHEEFIRADDEQKVVEIWNDVFMTYEKRDGVIVGELDKKNIDTGAGLERLAMVLQGKNNIFETDLFAPLLDEIKENTGDKYEIKAARIVADHLRAAVFMITDGVTPTNTDRGYVLRRLLRRAIRYADKLSLPAGHLNQLAEMIISDYGNAYPELTANREKIKTEIETEAERFRQTLAKGLKEFNWQIKTLTDGQVDKVELPPLIAFNLATTYGFPFELIEEEAKFRGMTVDYQKFQSRMENHKRKSRAGAEQKFKGGLADTGEQSVKYHTATHLLHQALKEVLGESVEQRGSNITPERLRFDFAFERKLTDEEKERVETIVNEKIKADLPVKKVILPRAEAEASGAHHLFADKYGEQVSVYFVGDNLDTAYSKEFCGGPHVVRTGVLGNFKITKEEAVAAGIRRIKAVLE